MSSRSLICYSAQGPNADRRCVTLRTFAAAGSTSEAELQTLGRRHRLVLARGEQAEGVTRRAGVPVPVVAAEQATLVVAEISRQTHDTARQREIPGDRVREVT